MCANFNAVGTKLHSFEVFLTNTITLDKSYVKKREKNHIQHKRCTKPQWIPKTTRVQLLYHFTPAERRLCFSNRWHSTVARLARAPTALGYLRHATVLVKNNTDILTGYKDKTFMQRRTHRLRLCVVVGFFSTLGRRSFHPTPRKKNLHPLALSVSNLIRHEGDLDLGQSDPQSLK